MGNCISDLNKCNQRFNNEDTAKELVYDNKEEDYTRDEKVDKVKSFWNIKRNKNLSDKEKENSFVMEDLQYGGQGIVLNSIEGMMVSPSVLDTEEKLGLVALDSNRNDNTNFTTHFNKSFAILFNDNSTYIGTFNKNWEKHGNGTLYLPDGSKYVGNFLDDRIYGKGRLIYSNGEYYEGSFCDDKPNGFGIYMNNEQVLYKGFWKDEMKCGMGEETRPDGSVYLGEYLDDMKHGSGQFKWADGTIYEGEIKFNNMEGMGKTIYSDGKIYVGEWQNNKIHGRGIFWWPDKRRYLGEYKAEKKSGYGIFIWPNEKKYEGSWLNGKQHGYGLCSSNRGEKKLGEWRLGKKIRWIENWEQIKDVLEDLDKQNKDILSFCSKLGVEDFDDSRIKDKLVRVNFKKDL